MNSQLAMIMLTKSSNIKKETLVGKLNSDWANIFHIDHCEEKDGIISFDSDKMHFTVSELPLRIPSGELEIPVKTAFLWRSAGEDIKEHKMHQNVFVSGNVDKIIISKYLTMLVSSLIGLTDPIGVYWSSSSQVIKSEVFSDFSGVLKQGSLPIPIWVKATGYQNKDRTYYLYTTGLKEYGYKEFEIESYSSNMSDGLYFLMDFSDYVLSSARIIRDGEKVDVEDEQNIRVKFKRSSIKPDEEVVSILF